MLFDGRFVPGSSFLAFLGVTLIGSPGSSFGNRRTITSPLVTCLRVVASYFKGCSVGGSERVIEDILLSECDGGVKSRGNRRASCA